MALGGIYETGTVTIAVDRVSVTGVGTFWSPIVEIGDWLFVNGQVGLVAAIIDDTHLTLETQWQGTLPSAAVYVVIKMSWLRYDPALTQAKVRQLLEELDAQGNFLFVEGDEPDPALGEDGQWALKTNETPWQVWFKEGGVWVEQPPPGGTGGGATGFYHVKEFGAVCDGVADDTAALQAALNTGKEIHFDGTMKTTATVAITVDGTQLVGSSQFHSAIACTDLDSPVITVAGDINIMITNCTIRHTGVPVNGGDGIKWLGRAPVCTLMRLNVTNNFINLALGPATFSHLIDLWVTNAIHDNIQMTPTATVTGHQWQIDQVISQGAGRHGMFVTSSGGPAATGCTLGNWTRYSTFGNAGAGLYILGTSDKAINALRLSDCFLGSDGGNEIVFDSTHGGSHIIADTYVELSAVYGIYLSANNGDLTLDNCVVGGCAQDGVYTDSTVLNIVGGNISGNTGAGVRIGQAGRLTIAGATITGNSIGVATAPLVINGSIVGGYIWGNSAAQFSNSSTGVIKVRGVYGIVDSTRVIKQAFTASGTYAPTPGMTFAIIECWGAGGGGGGTQGFAGQTRVSAGGGGGGYSRKVATNIEIGGSQTVTIGIAGVGGAAGANAGAAGGQTSVGSLCIANGGQGGPGGGFSTGGTPGGAAGTGDIAATGMLAGTAIGAVTAGMDIGCGAHGANSTIGGGGGGGVTNNTAAAGGAATGFASGGGGASANNSTGAAAGGNGAPGYVFITEYTQ